VPAARQPLTTDPASPVSHDTEVMALAGQGGRLFAATDQWEYPGSPAYGQVLVKDAAVAPWRVFEGTRSLRVQAIDSFPIPADQGLGPATPCWSPRRSSTASHGSSGCWTARRRSPRPTTHSPDDPDFEGGGSNPTNCHTHRACWPAASPA